MKSRKEYIAAWRARNPEKVAEYAATYQRRHPGRVSATQARWYQRNKERARIGAEKWQKENPEKAAAARKAYRRAHLKQYSEYALKWVKAHPAEDAKRSARRRAAETRATPAWADQRLIQFKYDLAARMTKATGYQWDVDHVFPLRHKLFCGLHVDYNLQVITHAKNMSKGNRVQL